MQHTLVMFMPFMQIISISVTPVFENFNLMCLWAYLIQKISACFQPSLEMEDALYNHNKLLIK